LPNVRPIRVTLTENYPDNSPTCNILPDQSGKYIVVHWSFNFGSGLWEFLCSYWNENILTFNTLKTESNRGSVSRNRQKPFHIPLANTFLVRGTSN